MTRSTSQYRSSATPACGMQRGCSPTPTRLKLVAGSSGHRTLPDSDLAPERVLPDCPDHLSELARIEWGRVAPELLRLGLLTVIDGPALALYCQAYGLLVEAEKKAAEHGLVVTMTNGNLIRNPYHSIATRARRQMHELMAEFGMTPGSRMQVTRVDAGRDCDSEGRFVPDFRGSRV